MKIATTTVSKEGSSDARFAAFKEALERAKREEARLLCLPGGYFCVRSDSERKKVESRIVQAAKQAGVAVALGIDRSKGRRTNKKKTSKSNTDYQSFAIAWSRLQKPETWPQRSSNTTDQWDVPEKDCNRPQTLSVAGKRIEVLACGELFNERIRNSIIDRHPDAVVDLSHDGRGFRADHSMKLLARQGMYTFCCTHANKKGAMKRAFAPGGRKTSTPEANSVITGKPRIEMKICEI
ncbi:MAG: hypothetical protein ABSB65_14040 [Candidatus Acidiferrales bacterium]|jgi:hypothetical protein